MEMTGDIIGLNIPQEIYILGPNAVAFHKSSNPCSSLENTQGVLYYVIFLVQL